MADAECSRESIDCFNLEFATLEKLGIRAEEIWRGIDLGLYEYPEDPVAEVRAAGTRVFSFDASAIAKELGEIRLGNTVMLGAISDYLPFPPEVLEQCILKRFARKKPELIELNRRAFAAGRAASAHAAATESA